jgi:hypothetical protein
MNCLRKLCLCTLLFACIVINGCNPNSIPLKGNYPTGSTEIVINEPSDSIWSKLEGLFTANGLLIKNIDKKKGLILTKKTSFIPAYTFEDKDGQLQEPMAWIVLARVKANKKEWNPKSIYSQWSIQLTETGNGTTTVAVNPIVDCTYFPNMFLTVETRGQSTGRLEKMIRNGLARP